MVFKAHHSPVYDRGEKVPEWYLFRRVTAVNPKDWQSSSNISLGIGSDFLRTS